MLFPPHNLRARIKFRKPETVYYYVGRIIEIRTAPSNARVTPQSLLSDPGRILCGNSRTKQIKFILCGSMRLYRSSVTTCISGECYSRMINVLRIEVTSSNLDVVKFHDFTHFSIIFNLQNEFFLVRKILCMIKFFVHKKKSRYSLTFLEKQED